MERGLWFYSLLCLFKKRVRVGRLLAPGHPAVTGGWHQTLGPPSPSPESFLFCPRLMRRV